jgi:hypothetical protein
MIVYVPNLSTGVMLVYCMLVSRGPNGNLAIPLLAKGCNFVVKMNKKGLGRFEWGEFQNLRIGWYFALFWCLFGYPY